MTAGRDELDAAVEAHLRARGAVDPPGDLTERIVGQIATTPVRRGGHRSLIALAAAAIGALVAAVALPGLREGPAPSASPPLAPSSVVSPTATTGGASLPYVILGRSSNPAAIDLPILVDEPGDCTPLPSDFLRELCRRFLEDGRWRRIADGIHAGPNPRWYAALARAHRHNDATICGDDRLIEWLASWARDSGGSATVQEAQAGCRAHWLMNRIYGRSVSDPDGRTVVVNPVVIAPRFPPRAALLAQSGLVAEGRLGDYDWPADATQPARDMPEPASAIRPVIASHRLLTIILSDGVVIRSSDVTAASRGGQIALPDQVDASPFSVTAQAPDVAGPWRVDARIEFLGGGYGVYSWDVDVWDFVPLLGGPRYPADCAGRQPEACSDLVLLAEASLGLEHGPIVAAQVGGQICPPNARCALVPESASVRFDFVDGSHLWIAIRGTDARVSEFQPEDPGSRPDVAGFVEVCPPGAGARCQRLAGAVVELKDSERRLVRRIVADQDGEFIVRAAPGKYRLDPVPTLVPIGLAAPADVELGGQGPPLEVSLTFTWPDG